MSTARGQSYDPQDSDIETPSLDGHEGETGKDAAKPGRKKNPNSQAARRDQNRIAQREFRLRKQQRIRDLEARVEILSGSKDEAVSELRLTLKDLMEENQQLRNLVRGLSQFIGEGSGGLLSKLGWGMEEFTNFVNRGETDTAYESYQRRKKLRAEQEAAAASQNGQGGHKRSAEEQSIMGPSKKARESSLLPDPQSIGTYPLMVSVPPAPSPGSTHTGAGRSSHESSLFSDLMRGSGGSPMFMPPAPASTQSTSPTYGNQPVSNAVNGQLAYQPPYANPPIMPSGTMNSETPLVSMPFTSNTPVSMSQPQRTITEQVTPREADVEDDPKKNEAYKLIHYHLDNYKRNRGYCLPASLRPTLVQSTVPHESVIDGIVHPELRDRIILLRGRFDLIDCLHEYRINVTVHGDDVLAHTNWELNEKWLRKYSFLADQATLNTANRWRRERGEPDLLITDIVPGDGSSEES
ncbi:hypothetical protein PUNSTDRAFT_142625 [Punctularia strigosozonata HHB-11173 SS5]|uniref:uncharacterized protein n=1 Tax=Punctularia strigosozonata (strain HHB-11173) TaxID=741275 RepID=UPI000441768C|nr:uncharacterized protein PUNSTDRAFT_142625 [Punctularia strigosozonata HHB-11173 SS5]EIN10659.1 hypothetical protein PUNSTDRAFT_142625 [Punctularia strigosozonata HHB-11173 SS5]